MHALAFLNVLLFSTSINILIGLYVLWTRPRDPVRQSFFLLVMGAAAWIGGLYVLTITHDFRFDKFIHFGGMLLILGLVWFSRLFPKRLGFPIAHWLFFGPFILASLIIVPWNGIVARVEFLPNGDFVAVNGPFSVEWALMLGAYILFGLYSFVVQYRRAAELERLQLRYLILGLGVFMGASLVCDIFLPAFGDSSFKFIGPLSSIIFIALTGYAIMKHRLMDIRIIIQRGLVYTLLLVGIVGLYLLLINVLGLLFGDSLVHAATLSGGIVTIAGIFGTPIIERYFRRITDRFFFKDRYDYADAMHALSETLHTATSFEAIITGIEDQLAQLLRASDVRIVLGADAAPGSGERDVSIPIMLEETLLGRINVGTKLSGDSYPAEDVRLLETFSFQAATALARVQLYEEVKRHAEELEQKVHERTEEIQALQESQRQMMIDLSHNLQTPLAILKSKLERARRSLTMDGELRGLEQSVDTLSSFIYDLLELSTLERTLKQEERAAFSFSRLLEEIVEEVTVIATQSDIRVRDVIAPEIRMHGNQKRLREMIMNIASNAVKYMREDGTKEIRFELRGDGDEAVLRIEDTGLGIAPEDLPHIFERFYRGAKAYGGAPGTGLGLAIVERIVTEHGGAIQVESSPDTGSVFILRLPRLTAGS